MIATISTHNRPIVRQRHNRRDPAVVRHEDHIDPNGRHEEWLDVDELDAYREIFTDAVQRYNKRQQREERKLTVEGYFQTVKDKELAGITFNRWVEEENRGLPAEKRKLKKQNFRHTSYEMTVGVYGYAEKRDENGRIVYEPLRNEDDEPLYQGDEPVYTARPVIERVPVGSAVAEQILREFYEGWAERNPHLKLFGAYFHFDEEGKDPHLHLDYVPVATGYTRGLDTQVAVERALRQQGFCTKNARDTAQIQWERRENEVLEQICGKYGITVIHPQAGKGVKHLDKISFQRSRDAQNERRWAEEAAARAMLQKAAMEQEAEGAQVWAEAAAQTAEDAERRAGFAARKADEEAERYARALTGRVRAEREKKALEARTAALRRQAESYPTDLQERLDGLSRAAQTYQQAAAADEGGPLVRFLKGIKIRQRQQDGTVVSRPVYDVWQEYRQRQERQLQEQADRVRQSGVAAQRQLSARLDGVAARRDPDVTELDY